MKRINYKKASLVEFIIMIILIIIYFLGVHKSTVSNLEKRLFKTYIETGESTGEYSLSDSLAFPTTGYKFNAERSFCTNGGDLSYDAKRYLFSLFTSQSTICTLYFDVQTIGNNSTYRKLNQLNPDILSRGEVTDFSVREPSYSYVENEFVAASNSYSPSDLLKNVTIYYYDSYTFDSNTGTFTLGGNVGSCQFKSCSGTNLKNKYVNNYTTPSRTSDPLSTIYRIDNFTNLFGSVTMTYSSATASLSSVDNSLSGLYEMEDDYGTSYFFRGQVDNNYLRFANLYWRIIRINGDGSLRVLYDGTTANAKSTIGTSAFNSTANSNASVGYMYGDLAGSTYELTHANTNSSSIKTVIDNWYANNLSSYEEYLSDTVFCNDRRLLSGTGAGTISATTYYAPSERTTNPSLMCSQSNDNFGVINGNQSLSSFVGTITMDEVILAGSTATDDNEYNYIYKNTSYWTMSPYGGIYTSSILGSSAIAEVYTINKVIADTNVTTTSGVVPVINISGEAVSTMTGTGTASNPFVIN